MQNSNIELDSWPVPLPPLQPGHCSEASQLLQKTRQPVVMEKHTGRGLFFGCGNLTLLLFLPVVLTPFLFLSPVYGNTP